MIGLLFSPLGRYIAIGGIILVGLFGVYLKIRADALVAARIPLSEAHKYHVDEIVPVSKGGYRNKNNTQVIEASLNSRKSDRG